MSKENFRHPERWVEFKKGYWVSDEGRFKRVYKNGKAKMLSTYNDDYILCVKVHSQPKNARKIVWETFRGPIPEGYVVYNMHHCQTMCDLYSLKCTDRVTCAKTQEKKTAKKILHIDTGKVYLGTREAAKALYCSRQTISDICNGRMKRQPAVNVRWLELDE